MSEQNSPGHIKRGGSRKINRIILDVIFRLSFVRLGDPQQYNAKNKYDYWNNDQRYIVECTHLAIFAMLHYNTRNTRSEI